jgi:thioredoxin 1
MSTVKLTSENFNKEVIQSEVPALVDFYADWCGPCKMMAPIMEEISEALGEKATVGKLNIDQNQDLAMEYGVMSIPTILVFKDGKVVKTFVGVTDKNDILNEF